MTKSSSISSEDIKGLKEILEIEKLSRLLEQFYSATGLANFIVDLKGNILHGVGWKSICMEFHRKNKISSERCLKSDTILANRLKKKKKYSIYICHNGMVDVATPIIIDGVHVANLFIGQFFFETPDKDFFINQAEELGFDKEKYMKALEECHVYNKETILRFLDFFSGLINMIGESVLKTIKQKKQVEEKADRAAELVIADKELAFQNEEKADRAAELIIANKELAFQNKEKDKRAAELIIANKELAFQNKEKDKRAAELIIANKELAFQKEALKQSEEKYRSLVVNINDVIYTLNAEGHITYISPVVERLAAYKAVEIIGKLFMSYIHPEDQHGLLESFKRTLSGQVEPAEFRLLRKDGTSIYVRALNRALAENGQVSLTGVLSDITESKRAEERLRESHTKLAKTFEQTVESLSSIAEMRDPYTAGHQVRVAKLAREIASEIGMSTEQMSTIRTAALLHDIGKIIVPPEILNKPGKLNALERSFVEAHAQASYEILKTIEFEFPIAEIILQHHEKLDGSGYPRGLSGDSILKEARVLAVADVIEAMASHRPYRPALPLKTALEEISSHRGAFYDADVVDACLRLFLEKGLSL